MNIKIKIIKENLDGSALVEMDMDQEAMHLVFERGINHILEAAFQRKRMNDLISEWESENGVSEILGDLPKKSRKANSEKKLGKTVARKQTKGTRGNSRAPKILGKKRN
jgi:hypothetical protein